MLTSRMALKPFLSLTQLLLWTALSTVATAQQNTNNNIPSEVTNAVPNCARDCFRSFILANFGSSGCGTSPSLRCLCTKTGVSGYTLGEGAFACAVAEANRGNCQGADAASNVRLGAYSMCSRIPNAAPATHDTIVATLIVPSGSGGLVVPTAAPTTTPSTSTTGTSTSATPTSTSSGSSQPVATNSAQSKLSAPVIAGISLGVIAGVVAFGVFLIFLARCIRRRRFGGLDPEVGSFSKMRDSLSFGRGSSNQGSPPGLHGGLQISNPIHKTPVEMDFQRPYQPHGGGGGGGPQYPSSNNQMPQPHPGMIGLAISPQRAVAVRSNSTATQPSAFSPVPTIGPAMVITPPPQDNTTVIQAGQSPIKPALTLAIPKGRSPLAGAGAGAASGAGVRDSVVTEFAEDGEGESIPNTSSIWRPPPSDPQSAVTYYFADKGGNWVLRNPSTTGRRQEGGNGNLGVPVSPQVELPSPEDKTRAERAQDLPVVAPLRVPATSKNKALGSPIAFRNQSRVNRSSSVYTSDTRPQSTASGAGAPVPLPPPETYFAMMREGSSRNLTSTTTATPPTNKKRRAGAGAGAANRRVSHQSSTSIESGAAGPFEDEDIIEDELQVDLSPVQQSPLTPVQGRSPVSYPKIPKGQGGLSLFPFPYPSDRSRDNSLSPSGQASPTLGSSISPTPVPTPVNNSRVPSPNNKGRLLYPGAGLGLPSNPHPNRNPGQVRTGSPETRNGLVPGVPGGIAELPATPQRRPSPSQGLGISSQTPSPRPGPQKRYPTPPRTQPTAEGGGARSPRQNQGQGGVGAGSLLAKRLGADKAAALSLASNETPSLQIPKRGWTRESFAPGPSQPAAQRPQGSNPPGIRVTDGSYVPVPGPVPPGTPGWIPVIME